jgi:hypothetical protein
MIFKTKHTLRSSLIETRAEIRNQGLLGKSKLAQLAYKEGHRVSCDESRILEIESNSRCRKYKELAHMECLAIPISQPSLNISPIWVLLIN